MISGMVLQILAILLILAVFITFVLRPSGVFPIVLAVGVVAAAIFVSWNDVEQSRAERAAQAASPQENASTGVTVPPPSATHSGS